MAPTLHVCISLTPPAYPAHPTIRPCRPPSAHTPTPALPLSTSFPQTPKSYFAPINSVPTTCPPTLLCHPSPWQTTIDYPSPQALSALKAKQDQLEKQRHDTQVSHAYMTQPRAISWNACVGMSHNTVNANAGKLSSYAYPCDIAGLTSCPAVLCFPHCSMSCWPCSRRPAVCAGSCKPQTRSTQPYRQSTAQHGSTCSRPTCPSLSWSPNAAASSGWSLFWSQSYSRIKLRVSREQWQQPAAAVTIQWR